MSSRTHTRWYWGIAFLGVFLLSQDYLFVDWSSNRGLLGFPVWLGWFIFVHVAFIGLFFLFAKKYWK